MISTSSGTGTCRSICRWALRVGILIWENGYTTAPMQNMTEPQFGYFRSMSKLFLCFLFILFTASCLQATAQPNIIEVQLADSPTQVYIDRPGDLYIKTEELLIRFDSSGKISGTWQFPNASVLFEPRDGSRMFYFNPADRTWALPALAKHPHHPFRKNMPLNPCWPAQPETWASGYWMAPTIPLSA